MKKAWEYRGQNANGFLLNGTLYETSRQDAEATARRMGVLNPIIIDPSESPKASLPEANQPEAEQMPSHPLSTPPPTVNLIPEREQKNISSMMQGMKDVVSKHIAAENETKVRQTLLIGDELKIKTELEPFLSQKNGHILSLQMRPNQNGIMIFAVVIEHQEKKSMVHA